MADEASRPEQYWVCFCSFFPFLTSAWNLPDPQDGELAKKNNNQFDRKWSRNPVKEAVFFWGYYPEFAWCSRPTIPDSTCLIFQYANYAQLIKEKVTSHYHFRLIYFLFHNCKQNCSRYCAYRRNQLLWTNNFQTIRVSSEEIIIDKKKKHQIETLTSR